MHWHDYFKPEHLEKHPGIHDTFWRATKQASKVKQSMDVDAAKELLLMIDAFKRASAWRITAVLPYYCYARQDRKDKPRVPISAKLVADLLETAGASRASTRELHAPQMQGYLAVPVVPLYGSPVLV